MLDFFKKLLRKEEPSVMVSQEGLERWFSEKSANLKSNISAARESLKSEIRYEIRQCHDSIRELSEAELRNPNIPVKEIQYMEGNRKSYVHRTGQFLREIEGILDFDIQYLLQQYQESISAFAKSTSRSYAILQNFFAHEAQAVAGKLKAIDSCIGQLHTSQAMRRASDIEQIEKDIFLLSKKIQARKAELQESEQIKKSLEDIDKLHGRQQSLISELLSGSEYRRYKELEQQESLHGQNAARIKDHLVQVLSPLERPLRKYQRISLEHDKLIEHYLADAMSALASDFSLQILVVLENLRKNLEKDALQLKEKQLQKTKEHIAGLLGPGFLSSLKKEYASEKEAEAMARSDRQELAIFDELENAKEKLRTIEGHRQRLKERLASLEIAPENMGPLREGIARQVEKLLGIRLVIK